MRVGRRWVGSPVVERALEPLDARGHERVLVQDHQVPREAADALGAHRVALVRHRGRADLRRLKRLLHFLWDYARQRAEVVDSVGGCMP